MCQYFSKRGHDDCNNHKVRRITDGHKNRKRNCKKLIKRCYLQNDFTLSVHLLSLQMVNSGGLVPKTRAKYGYAAEAKPTHPCS